MIGVCSWVCISETGWSHIQKRKTHPRKLKHTSWKVKAVYFWGTQTSKMDHRSNFNYSIRLLNNIKRGAIMSFTGPVLFLNGGIRSCFGFVFVIFLALFWEAKFWTVTKRFGILEFWYCEVVFLLIKKQAFHHSNICKKDGKVAIEVAIEVIIYSNISPTYPESILIA